MAVKVLRVFQEFTSAGYVPMPIAGNIDYGVTVANTFPAATPATFQTDDPDIEVDVTEVTDFYVWIRSHGTAWNYLYTRNVRVYPDSPTINNVVMGIIIARLTDAVPYTGATQDTDLGEFGLKAGWLGLDLTPTNTPTDAGTMSWNDQDGTANLILKGGNVTLQIGQEQVTRVVNKTGSSLLEANYQAVRISGAQGNRLKVALAQANNDANSAETLGIVTETILNNEEGFITTSGLVRNIDTTGTIQGEVWADGDMLYLSGTTAGQLTNVKPQAPTHTVIMGYVVRAHATQGQIYVKVDNGYELDELHNVRITTPADKDFLIYDGTNQYWKNRDLFGTTGYLPVYDTTSLLKDSIIYTDGTAIGIGTNVLQSGAVATFGDVAHFTENISLADSKGIVSGGVNMLSRNNLNNQIIIGADGGINDNVAFYAGDLERMRLLANGRLAINKTTASYQVDVQGDVNVSGAFRVNGTIIPNGTVTSVAMSVPTGLVISGSPITSSGTLAVTYAVNYGIPTLTKQSDWDDAYTWVTNFPDQLGNAGKFLTTNGSVLSWASLVTGVSSVFGRTGAVTAQSGDYTTAQVTESGNLYYTDARARLALSGGTGITYNNTTGVIAYSGTVYTDSSIRALFSAGAGISYNNTTGVITSTITQYTDAMARASLSFVAGSGAYNSTTGVITIPTNTNQLTNGASFITLASLSASAPLSYNNGTGAFSISQASGSTNGFLSSTDWNTFNNKQNALTNPVTGTGTTNYLPKFTGSTSIGNSLIFDNGTNVGINTASPSTRLTIDNSANANTNSIDLVGYGSTGKAHIGQFANGLYLTSNYYYASGQNYDVATLGQAAIIVSAGTTNTSIIAFNLSDAGATSPSEKMRINASGNIGLNVTPSAWSVLNVLQINNAAFGGLGNNAYMTGNAYYDGSSWRYIASSTATLYAQQVGTHVWYNAVSGTAGGAISYNQAMTLNASGNLGLGVTPSAWTAGGSNIEVGAAGNIIQGQAVQIAVIQNATFNAGWKYSANGFASFALQTSGQHQWFTAPSGTAGTAISFTQAMTLNASGNLGIGSTNPDEILTLNRASSLYARIVNTSNSVSTYWGVNGTEIYFGSSSNSPVTFYSNSTERMRINAGGNVSIGNTNNTYKLDVNNVGAGVANTRIYGNDQSNVRLRLENAGAGGRTYEIVGGLAGANNSSFSIFDATASSTRLQIDSTGAATFSSSVKSTLFEASSVGTTKYHIGYYSGGLNFAETGIADFRLFIKDGGNVGIGTTSPQWLLELYKDTSSGSFGQYPAISVNNPNASGYSAYYFFQGSTNKGGIEYSNSSNSFIFYGNGAERMRITSGGNVGIGTTSPSTRLEVLGTDSSGDRTNPYNVLTVTAENGNAPYNGFGGAILFKNRSYSWGIVNSARVRSIINDNSIVNDGGALAFDVTLTAGGAFKEAMRINYGGNVGIGTTSPTNGLLVINSTSATGVRFALESSGTMNGIVALGNNAISGLSTTDMALWTRGVMAFETGASGEKMRLDASGNLMVATTSASNSAGGRGNITIGGSSTSILNFQIGGSLAAYLYHDNNNLNILNSKASGELLLSTNSTERMRITSGGQIYMGNSAGDGYRLQIFGTNQAGSTFGQTYIGVAAYSQWVNSSGAFVMGLDGASGTTERMRITSGGDVNIGSSPSTGYKFNVRNASGNYISFWSPTIGGVATNGFLSHNGGGFNSQVSMGYNATVHVFNGEVTGGGTMQVAGDVNISGAFKINGTAIGTGGGGVSGSGSTDYVAKWSAGTSLTNSNITDNGTTITLYHNTGSGNVSFTYNNTTWGTGVNMWNSNVYPYGVNAGGIYFSVSGTQRMYLKSNGTLLYTANGNLDIIGNTTSGGSSIVRLDSTTGIGYNAETVHVFYTSLSEVARFNGAGEFLIGTSTDNGAYKLQVNSQIWATNATIATSDVRLKDNIQDISNALSVIMGLKPRTFTYKQDKGFNFGKFTNTGFIAQEIKESMTGLNYLDSIVLECGNYYGVAYEKFIPILTKGIQEQQEIIERLEEKIRVLESNVN